VHQEARKSDDRKRKTRFLPALNGQVSALIFGETLGSELPSLTPSKKLFRHARKPKQQAENAKENLSNEKHTATRRRRKTTSARQRKKQRKRNMDAPEIKHFAPVHTLHLVREIPPENTYQSNGRRDQKRHSSRGEGIRPQNRRIRSGKRSRSSRSMVSAQRVAINHHAKNQRRKRKSNRKNARVDQTYEISDIQECLGIVFFSIILRRGERQTPETLC
jgi:hypothetical protein